MDELYGTINTSLLNLEGDIAELESNHLNTDFPEVQNMISALKIFINDQLSRSRAYLVEYTPQQLANSAVYADLFNANQVLVTSQSARADEFQIACEHENNRAELLEEESAQRREEEGWWNAVAAVGTIVIGTVAIVCTAGMATPVVVTAVAAGSCSIAYGASNLVEAGQDIYYGSVGDATTVAFNPIRDTVFAGNQELYDIWGGISTTVAGFVVPVGQAYTTAKAAGSTTKAVLTATGNAILKEGAQDVAVNLASSGAGSVVMNLTDDVNASRLFGLGTGFLAGGKINSVDNATDAIRRLDDITDSTRTLDDITDVTRTLDSLDNITDVTKTLDNLDNITDVTKTLDDVTDSTRNIENVVGEVKSKTKAEILAENREKGRAFELEKLNEFKQTANNVEEQITIVTNDGTKIKIDAIGYDSSTGKLILREYKSSETAPLTKNQIKGFPELKDNGGVVVGKGKGIFKAGVEIPPGTIVEIIRPD